MCKIDCLPNVSSIYGAPMGRAEYGQTPENGVFLHRVSLDSGGYDKGGAYWGIGQALFIAHDDNGDYQAFVRAKSRAHAAQDLKIVGKLRKQLTQFEIELINKEGM